MSLIELAFAHGWCAKCKQHGLLFPLHGEKGGPMVCLTCRGAWHAEHGKRRNRGRVVIRAIKAFIDGGGPIKDLDKLKFAAIGHNFGFGEAADELGYLDGAAKISDEIIELTSELLNEAIALTHPDKHPPERREQATRVTQKLTDLKPFVFPAPQPNPPPIPQAAPPRNASVNVSSADLKERLRPAYPCPQCAGDIPLYYCDACKAEHNKRWKAERKRTNLKQRQQYARRKARKARRAPPKLCPCGATIKGKRKDARYCSDACRQRAHRQKSPPKIGVDIAPMIPRLLEAMPRWERP